MSSIAFFAGPASPLNLTSTMLSAMEFAQKAARRRRGCSFWWRYFWRCARLPLRCRLSILVIADVFGIAPFDQRMTMSAPVTRALRPMALNNSACRFQVFRLRAASLGVGNGDVGFEFERLGVRRAGALGGNSCGRRSRTCIAPRQKRKEETGKEERRAAWRQSSTVEQRYPEVIGAVRQSVLADNQLHRLVECDQFNQRRFQQDARQARKPIARTFGNRSVVWLICPHSGILTRLGRLG